MTIQRAIVSRKTLDALIRAKLATIDGCTSVEALPVTWSNGNGGHGAAGGKRPHCNWVIPGWVGEGEVVKSCAEKLDHYLDFLREQFDIPAPSTAGGDD